MRYAIIADIHANLAAFTAVLDDIELKGGVEEVWCLGDIVGYGPDPHQCLELLRQYNHVCVAGNHDWAAIGKLDTSDFNPDAATACNWTRQQLTPEDIEYLDHLPLVIEKGDFTLVHGSPREPIWEYLLSTSAARENFAYLKSQFCLVGHSHVPIVFSETGYVSQFPAEGVLRLTTTRIIINPGGVGQPRDGNPYASYAIYDSETRSISLYRIPYDIAATQARMVEYKLPMRLVARLSYGV
ncbi:metallophosphatase family protein [Dehalococcoidales bacterium]|nr:metallophosphatase family protein [Dehalococcoidales bacterium]MCL0094766.1 metallophosphatase family protein [Dehalococcoidales bacterium]